VVRDEDRAEQARLDVLEDLVHELPQFGAWRQQAAVRSAACSEARSGCASTSIPIARSMASDNGSRGQRPARSIGLPANSICSVPRTASAVSWISASARSIMSR
jgi:hypothetical protein